MPLEGPVVSFCERVTPQEYKEQSLITSQRSLKDLLNRIVDDESLSAKDKKKQLKRVSFPKIYFDVTTTWAENITTWPTNRSLGDVRMLSTHRFAGRLTLYFSFWILYMPALSFILCDISWAENTYLLSSDYTVGTKKREPDACPADFFLSGVNAPPSH